jgi:hypothetical protein
MLIDSSSFRPSSFVCRTLAVALFASAPALALHAQQADNNAPRLAAPSTKLDLTSLNVSSLDLAEADGVSYSSSSAPLANTDTATLDFKGLPEEATQPPPRRRYGRPRYNDSSHNPDGSNKYTFIGGVGVDVLSGNTHKYYTPSYDVQVGGGRNFNKHFAVLLQFDYDHLGLQGSTLANQQNLYNYGVAPGNQVTGLDGNAHVWSFTVDPTYTFYSGDTLGAYVVGGVGFFHKVTNFTLPEAACADYYCEFEYEVDENVDHYTSNAPGFDGGFGFTYKPSRFAGERFYAEARYVYMDNSQRQGYTINNVATTTYNGYNAFPANSNRTTYIPIKLGLRF